MFAIEYGSAAQITLRHFGRKQPLPNQSLVKKNMNKFVIAQTLEAVITVSKYIFITLNRPIDSQQYVCLVPDGGARTQLNFVLVDRFCC